MKYILLIFFLLSLFLESSVTTIPFVFIVLLSFFVLERKEWVLFLALITGFFLDAITFRPLGLSGLFFSVFLFIVFIYERKFEIATVPFVLTASFIGSLFYLWIFYSKGIVVLESVFSAILGVLVFVLFSRLNKGALKKDVLGSKLYE